MDTPIYQSLDLNNKVDKYWLGYFFAQMGEIAKEVSDFIKPETHGTSENDLTRFFFGKLGHYRQEIKNHPYIVYHIGNNQLFQMKLMLETAKKEGIGDLLQAIQKDLLNSLIIIDSEQKINYAQTALEINGKYNTINTPEKSKDISKFEQNNLEALRKLIVILENGIESNLAQKIERYKSQQVQLQQKIAALNQELEEYHNLHSDHQSDNTTSIIAAQKVIVNKLISQVLKASVAIEIKQLLSNLTDDSYEKPRNELSIKQLKLIDLIKEFILLDPVISEKTFSKDLDIVVLISKKIEKYEKDIKKAINQFFNKCKSNQQDNYHHVTALEALLLDNKTEEDVDSKLFTYLHALESGSLTKDLDTIDRQLRSKEEEALNIDYRLKLTEKHFEKFRDLLTLNTSSENNKQTRDVDTNPKDKTSKILSILEKLNHELETLKTIEGNNNIAKSEYARKMSLGFIGQYLKELATDIDFQSYLNNDALFFNSIRISINTRHKVVMHGTLDNNANQLVMQATQHHLLPWQKSYESLKIIMLNDQGCKNLILKLFPPIPAWNGESSSIEEDMLVKVFLIGSYVRLMKYNEAEAVFLEDAVRTYLNKSDVSPILKLYLLIGNAKALFPKGDEGKTKIALENCTEYLTQLSVEMPGLYHLCVDIERDIYADLLLVDRDLKLDFSLFSFLDPNHQLKLADNLLERLRTEEAHEIITTILKEFESNQNSFTNLAVPRCKIGLDCYNLMSMYNRCIKNQEQAISYLTQAQSILDLNSKEFTSYWGGMTESRYASIHHLKSCCYNNWGKMIYRDINSNVELRSIVAEKFNMGYREGVAAQKYYEVNQVQVFDSARNLASMACSKAHLGILNENPGDLYFSKKLLEKAQEKIVTLTDRDASMPVCELWIELSGIYAIHTDEQKKIYCLAQAENNKYWKHCASYLKVPLSFETIILGEFPHFSTQDLTWNELYNMTNNDMTILGAESVFSSTRDNYE